MKEAEEDSRPVIVIGSNGRMGNMLLKEAERAGIPVAGLDQPLEDAALLETCSKARMVLVCVPARNLEEVIIRIAPFLPEDCILADITSVKEAPMRQMERHWHGAVVGTHPLFGPLAKVEDDRPVALVQGHAAGQEAMQMVEGFFGKLGCRVFRCTAEEHDKAMARIQNMNFITNLAYFAVTAGQDDLLPFLTPSFERRKQAAAKMLTEDAEMFAGLFESNSHSHEAVRQFSKMLNLAASGDIELLCRRAQWWWQDAKAEQG